nr:C-type lectin 37Db-like [Aedes albopictus]
MNLVSLALLLLAHNSFAAKTYIIPNLKASWHQANDHCKVNNMQLASFANDEEHNMLIKLMNEQLNCTVVCRVWIGANDLAHEGIFTWASTGKTIGFQKWKRDQPDNGSGWNKEEDCVEVLYEPSIRWIWEWNDLVCGNDGHFVCETEKHEVKQFK